MISLKKFKAILLAVQKKIDNELGIKLSTKITLCEIVFLGQEEPSVTLDFIQYPKFPINEKQLKKAIIILIKCLMDMLVQNRTVIVFSDESICLEKSDEIDPNINI